MNKQKILTLVLINLLNCLKEDNLEFYTITSWVTGSNLTIILEGSNDNLKELDKPSFLDLLKYGIDSPLIIKTTRLSTTLSILITLGHGKNNNGSTREHIQTESF